MFSIGWIGDCTKAKLSARKSPTPGRTQLPECFLFELAVEWLADIARNSGCKTTSNLRGAICVGDRGADENQ